MARCGLAATQLGLLVHELAHVYGAMPFEDVECGVLMEEGSVLENTEVYEAQECAELGAEVQVKHAQNYAFFASGEFLSAYLPGSCFRARNMLWYRIIFFGLGLNGSMVQGDANGFFDSGHCWVRGFLCATAGKE